MNIIFHELLIGIRLKSKKWISCINNFENISVLPEYPSMKTNTQDFPNLFDHGTLFLVDPFVGQLFYWTHFGKKNICQDSCVISGHKWIIDNGRLVREKKLKNQFFICFVKMNERTIKLHLRSTVFLPKQCLYLTHVLLHSSEMPLSFFRWQRTHLHLPYSMDLTLYVEPPLLNSCLSTSSMSVTLFF